MWPLLEICQENGLNKIDPCQTGTTSETLRHKKTGSCEPAFLFWSFRSRRTLAGEAAGDLAGDLAEQSGQRGAEEANGDNNDTNNQS